MVSCAAPPHLHRLRFPHHKDVQHVDVRVFAEDVGLGVVLEVSVVPPVSRSTLGDRSRDFSVQ